MRYIADRLLLWGSGVALASAILAAAAYWLVHRGHDHPRTVRDDLQRLYNGARAYYMDDAELGGGGGRLARPSTGFVPPLGECCRQGGKCKPDPAWWSGEPWSSLQFSMEASHYHSFAYRVGADGRSFKVAASGDLDCDGDYSTFEMEAQVDRDGGIPGGAPVFRDQELE